MPPTPLREALVCLVGDKQRLVGVLVLRQGTSFTLLHTLSGPTAALLSSPYTLEQLSNLLKLPVRLLDPDNSSFLGAKTILAARQGLPSYSLGR